jgi:biotin/methionine sulfoxide reductase
MDRKRFRNQSHWGAYWAEVEQGRVVGVTPFEQDPNPSPLIASIPGATHSKNRILSPMVRKGWLDHGPTGTGKGRGGEAFVEVSWDQAFELVSNELLRVKTQHGNESILGGSYGWSSAGIFHFARTQVRRFLFSFGGCTDQSANYSFGSATFFVPYVLGTLQSVRGPNTSWSAIYNHSDLVVFFGGVNTGNSQIAMGGSVAHTLVPWLNKISDRGIGVVNVSPCRDDVPEFMGADWVDLVPNTDTALMLALSHTLIEEGLHNPDFLDRFCSGFKRVRPYLMGELDGCPKDALWAEKITGIDAGRIRTLARRMASGRTFLSATWSLQRGDHGEMPFWALILLASVLGQVGLPGGGFGFGHGSTGGMGDERTLFNPPSLSMGRNPINFAIPAARLSDMLLNPGEEIDHNGKKITYPDIRLVYWAGGNPFHHHQDINRLTRAWKRPDTVIVNEPWWTPAARHADIVLPATTALERNDIGAAGRDPYLMKMEKAIEPIGQAKNDYDIFSELSRRLGCEEEFTEGRNEEDWLRFLYESCRKGARVNQAPMPDFDTFWQEGFYRIPERDPEYTLFQEFRSDPSKFKLRTPSGRIELFSEIIESYGYDDCPPHATWLEPAEWLGSEGAKDFPLHMISSQPTTRLHSQMDGQGIAAGSKIAGREPVYMNPKDAEKRGISHGDIVRIFNNRGACLAGAFVSDNLRPGVIRLMTGAWFDPADPGSDDTFCLHGNPNMLTLDKGTSKLTQAPIAQTALVQIERYHLGAPEVSVFDPPAFAEA